MLADDIDLNATTHQCKGVMCRRRAWAPRSREDAIFASAESLVRLGLVRTSG
jgi:hypothetical protein